MKVKRGLGLKGTYYGPLESDEEIPRYGGLSKNAERGGDGSSGIDKLGFELMTKCILEMLWELLAGLLASIT